jgi:hypothetical protein
MMFCINDMIPLVIRKALKAWGICVPALVLKRNCDFTLCFSNFAVLPSAIHKAMRCCPQQSKQGQISKDQGQNHKVRKIRVKIPLHFKVGA